MSARPPLILLDALGIDQPGGSRTAVLYPLSALFHRRPDWRYRVYVTQKEPLFDLPQVTQVVFPVGKGMGARLLAQATFPLAAWQHHADLVHFTKSQGSLVPSVKMVLTLFDVTTLREPEIHSPQAVFYWRHIQPRMAAAADAVMTISEDAKRDIVTLLGVPAEKVTVMNCAGQFTPDQPEAPGAYERLRSDHRLPDHYLLFVGILALKKNLITLVQALAELQARQVDFPPLVIAGPRYAISDASEIFEQIQHLGLGEKVLYIGPLPTPELHALYRHADLYIQPSLHEGFGIPTLEAMACGVPVIAAQAGALPEIVGAAGCLVSDVKNPQAWADSLQGLLHAPVQRQRLRGLGLQRAGEYTWERAAQTLEGLYTRLLGRAA